MGRTHAPTRGETTMPQFELSGSHAPMFRALDWFTQGYIEALFFTNEGPEDGQLGDAGFNELAPEALAAIQADCAAFQAQSEALLEQAYARDYEPVQAGRDFWFTRNHHGAGFWDRVILDAEELGAALTTAAHKCSGRDPYIGDNGKVYL